MSPEGPDVEFPADNSEQEDETQPALAESLVPEVEERGARLDRFLSGRFPDLSRTYLQRVLAAGGVTVDGVQRSQTFKVTPGQVIDVVFPEQETTDIQPEAIPLTIIYEDHDVLVLDKPPGLVVHPAPGHEHGTLVNGLLHHLPGLNVAGTNRPGIVHRLDRDTSGLMVVAKSDAGATSLREQWQARTVEKRYLALVRGVIPENEGTVDAPIGRHPVERQRMAVLASGKPALSHFTVLRRYREATLIEVTLVTGRTHQIRLHMQFAGYPVVGDEVYNRYGGPFGGKDAIVTRQFLHASRLAFLLPSSGARVEFELPLPDDLQQALSELEHEIMAPAP